MNEYFTHSVKLVPGTKARAEDVNSRFDAVEDGLDKLPAPHGSLKGFSEPVAVGTPTNSAHAVSVSQALGGGLSYGLDLGVENAYVVNLQFSPPSYTEGLTLSFKADHANTGASTINLNGLGIKQLARSDGNAVVAGDIVSGQIVTVIYNGTKFLGTTPFAGQLNDVAASVQSYAASASSSASTAITKAAEALLSKNAADIDAAATAADRLAISPASVLATSITSNFIAPSGYKTFTTQSGKGFIPGMKVRALYNDLSISSVSFTWMGGSVVSYEGSSLVISMETCDGSGTHNNWIISSAPTAVDVVRASIAEDIATAKALEVSDALVVKADKAVSLAQFAATTSLELKTLLTDETGSGAAVFANSPVLVTPNIGVAGGTSFNSITGLSSSNPVMDGAASSGAATSVSRGDHVHPSDTSRQAVSGKDASGGYAGLTLFKINFKNALNTITSFFTNANTTARTYTFQDRDGTIADNTDLAGKADNSAVALKAPIASPTFTGVPAGPTAAVGTNTTQFATTEFTLANSRRLDVLHVRDQKAQGTAGGTSVVGIQTRELNTVVGTNEISGSGLASNQITLPAGTYEVDIECPAGNSVSHNKARLYNVTDASYSMEGRSRYLSPSKIVGVLTISATKVFEVRHYIDAAYTTTGLGLPSSQGVEVYTEAIFRRRSS